MEVRAMNSPEGKRPEFCPPPGESGAPSRLPVNIIRQRMIEADIPDLCDEVVRLRATVGWLESEVDALCSILSQVRSALRVPEGESVIDTARNRMRQIDLLEQCRKPSKRAEVS
jgi:hypothetical protein